MKKEVRKLTITGENKTYYVTLPKWMIEKLKWRKGQKMEIRLVRGRIVIADWEG